MVDEWEREKLYKYLEKVADLSARAAGCSSYKALRELEYRIKTRGV